MEKLPWDTFPVDGTNTEVVEWCQTWDFTKADQAFVFKMTCAYIGMKARQIALINIDDELNDDDDDDDDDDDGFFGTQRK